jgi:hypothetical protein
MGGKGEGKTNHRSVRVEDCGSGGKVYEGREHCEEGGELHGCDGCLVGAGK